jgi:3-phenylpropionate/trans-cinnamate dioxygenase ferredoxin subunit
MRCLAKIEGRELAVFNVDGALYAIDNSCPHAGRSLFAGKLEGRYVSWPNHGLRFDLVTGCMRLATGLTVNAYAVSEVDGAFVVTLPDLD